MDDAAAYTEQLTFLRLQVREHGGASVDRSGLRDLCPDHLSVTAQFMRIAEIAQKEGWSFAFLADGSVRFVAYEVAQQSHMAAML
jgi:hypothetical protein